MKTGLLSISLVAALMLSGIALGQDPGQRDSVVIGNLDRTPIIADINQQVTVPVWLKSDDSITFIHIPLAIGYNYVATRSAGKLYPPFSNWDDKSFLAVNNNSPASGYASQSILGFAYLMDPRSPENFLYTGNKWLHIADFIFTATSDESASGDTVFFREGRNPANGGLLMGLADGLTEVVPAAIYGGMIFKSSGAGTEKSLPDELVIHRAEPNPFKKSTRIEIALPFKTDVLATIMDSRGQAVKTIKAQDLAAGENSIAWDGTTDDGRPVEPGFYVCHVKAGKFESKISLTLAK